jgi:hypothetical protein
MKPGIVEVVKVKKGADRAQEVKARKAYWDDLLGQQGLGRQYRAAAHWVRESKRAFIGIFIELIPLAERVKNED